MPIILLLALLTVLGSVQFKTADAQQPRKVPRLGFLSTNSAAAMIARYQAFRQGLAEFGYVEGRNIRIDTRYAAGRLDRLNSLALELVNLQVDIIVSAGSTATRSAKQATSTLPIVMGFDNDPVGSGFVTSLAHPGGNITGLSSLGPEISSKQLELLQESLPHLSRVAVLGNSTNPGNAQSLRESEVAARAMKIEFKYKYLDALSPKED